MEAPTRKERGLASLLPRGLVLGTCVMFAVTVSDAGAGPETTTPADSQQAAPASGREPALPSPSPEQELPAVSQEPEEGKADAPSSDGQIKSSPSATGAPPAGMPPETSGDDGDLVDALHGGISRGFLTSATWLDSFFGDERYEAEVNQSYLKVRFDAFREGSGGMDYLRPNFDLRLVLPQLRHKTRLVISGDPNADVDLPSSQPGPPATQLAKGPDRNVTTALQVVPLDTKRSNFSIRAGVKLHDGKLELLLGPRYRYLVHYGPWDVRFTQEEIWTTDIGWQVRSRFDVERPLPKDLFFRTSLEGVWTENVHGYPYALSFLLRQPLDSDRALQYEWVNSFQTRPTDVLTEELFVFRYRQRFWRDWLFLEIAPQVRFPRDRGFEFTPGILFRLEMVFGDIRNIF